MTLDKTIALLIGAAFGARVLDNKKGVVVRTGYGLVGYDLLRYALSEGNGPLLPGGTQGVGDANPTVTASGQKTVNLKFRETRVKSISERVAYIVQQMQVGTRDPRVYSLARSVLARKCGGKWCLPQGTLLLMGDGTLKPIERVTGGDTIIGDGAKTRVKAWWDRGSKPIIELTLNNGSVLRCTAEHQLFKVPRRVARQAGQRGTEIPIQAHAIRVGDELLQPTSVPFGTKKLSRDEAVIIGAYVSEGWLEPSRVSIAGIPNGKGVREKVIAAAKHLGLKISVDAFKVRILSKSWVTRLREQCGELAMNKHLPHTAFDESTTRILIEMLDADSRVAARSAVKTSTFNTTSPQLAQQYRVLQRMLGHSTGVGVDTRKGHPVYVVHVRQGGVAKGRKYWAKVMEVATRSAEPTFDIETESQRIYLPQADVVVHNCTPEKDAWAEACALFAEVKQRVRYTWDPIDYDAFQTPGKTLELMNGDCDDHVSLLGALLRTIGHPVACRVVHTKGFETWNHIYLRVRLPTGEWRPLDTTVNQPPGWEVPKEVLLKAPADFPVNEKGKPDVSPLSKK